MVQEVEEMGIEEVEVGVGVEEAGVGVAATLEQC
jgi:hypothetical protein